MKIIDRYILKKILSTFFFVVLILMAIITVIDITEKLDKFAKFNLSTEAILGYYIDFIPWVAGLITPITVFIAIIYVTSRMAGHTEIIAILSSGVSFPPLPVPLPDGVCRNRVDQLCIEWMGNTPGHKITIGF
ncbi:MAG: LptF/LptG family permease [Bacteroidota bacterium]